MDESKTSNLDSTTAEALQTIVLELRGLGHIVENIRLDQRDLKADNLEIKKQLSLRESSPVTDTKDSEKSSYVDSINSELFGFSAHKLSGKNRSVEIKETVFTRRKTMFNPTTTPSALTTVIMKTPAAYSHIKLGDFNIDHVISCIVAYNKWCQLNGTTFPIHGIMTDGVINHIIAQNDELMLSKDNIHQLSNDSLFDMVREIAQPKTILHFIEVLKKPIACNLVHKDPKSDRFEFDPVYKWLLSARSTFLQRLEFCAEKNDENIPAVHNKPGGLIHTFMLHLDSAGPYARARLSMLNPEDMRKFKTSEDFYNFLTLLYAKFKVDHEHNIHTKELKLAMSAPQYNDERNSKLLVLDTQHVSSDRKPTVDFDDEDDDLFNDPHLQFSSFGQKALPTSILPRVPNKPPYNSDKPTATPTAGCFRKLKHDKCDKPDCKYSHKYVDMHNLWKQETQSLAKSPFKEPPRNLNHHNLETDGPAEAPTDATDAPDGNKTGDY